MRCVVLPLALLLVASVSVTASAQAEPRTTGEATERARAFFTEGLALADRGDWPRAVHRFRRALELHDAASVRQNLATSLARMGRLLEAIEEVERILATPEADDEVRAAATALGEALRPRLGELRVEVRGGPSDGHVTVDGRVWTAGAAPAPSDPGIRVVRLHDGMVQLDIEEADVPEGGAARVILEGPDLVPLPSEIPTEPPEPEVDEDVAIVWGIVIGMVAVAIGGAITATVLLEN